MDTLIQIAQIIFILSVLVILHEFGHYLPAKLFKVRVEKFYLFMDPWFSLVKKKIGDTEWGIGWLPIGGYVKLSGMMDESMDKEQMNQPAQPWEFRSKPAWQRLIIMLGGITVNILLAWVIYTTLYSTYGQKYVSTEKMQEYGLSFGDVGHKVGFQNGDKIVSVDGKYQPRYDRMVIDVLLGDTVIVDRKGNRETITLTDENKAEIFKKEGKEFIGARIFIDSIYIDSISSKSRLASVLKSGDKISKINNAKIKYFDEFLDTIKKHEGDNFNIDIIRDGKPYSVQIKVKDHNEIKESLFIAPLIELKSSHIEKFTENSIAENAGVLKNDILVGFNNTKFQYFNEFKKALKTKAGSKIQLNVLRDNKPKSISIEVDKKGKLGFGLASNKKDELKIVNKMSFLKAIPTAVNESYTQFIYNIKQFKLILRPKTKAYTQVMSPIGITQKLPTEWNWEFVWTFTAMFSIGLAFMNLLPIPGLDGGHAIFTIAEMITGKTLSDKAAERVQTFGMIILLSLMALTFGKDIYQIIAKNFL